MRYVIVIVGVTVFLIWDAVNNNGEYLETAVRTVRSVFRMIGV